jgi:hypothetical protein
MDFVPLYGLTGKSDNGFRNEQNSNGVKERTRPNHDLICAFGHRFLIITGIKLSECRQGGGTHPVLEMQILLKVGEVFVRIIVGEALSPTWRRNQLTDICLGRSRRILFPLPWPSNARFREIVSLVLAATLRI